MADAALPEAEAAAVRVRVNGIDRLIAPRPGVSILHVLRDQLDLMGARYGCGEGACGACFVLCDGEAVAACRLTPAEVAGREIVTIEGLAGQGQLHPVQQAFIEEDAMQCGACTSGMILSAVALLRRDPHPDDIAIRDALDPHLCRCGVYGRAIRAVKRAAQGGDEL
jgi:aerobic-type carbon monoxide dehydrogenase small subunit (CoxS/CutS family)